MQHIYKLILIGLIFITSCGGQGTTNVGNSSTSTTASTIAIGKLTDGEAVIEIPLAAFGDSEADLEGARIDIQVNGSGRYSNLDPSQYYHADVELVAFILSPLNPGDVLTFTITKNSGAESVYEGTVGEDEASEAPLISGSGVQSNLHIDLVAGTTVSDGDVDFAQSEIRIDGSALGDDPASATVRLAVVRESDESAYDISDFSSAEYYEFSGTDYYDAAADQLVFSFELAQNDIIQFALDREEDGHSVTMGFDLVMNNFDDYTGYTQHHLAFMGNYNLDLALATHHIYPYEFTYTGGTYDEEEECQWLVDGSSSLVKYVTSTATGEFPAPEDESFTVDVQLNAGGVINFTNINGEEYPAMWNSHSGNIYTDGSFDMLYELTRDGWNQSLATTGTITVDGIDMVMTMNFNSEEDGDTQSCEIIWNYSGVPVE